MSRYGQYGNYYDPVGSQNAHASGYTYQPTNPPNSHLPDTSRQGGYQSNYQYGTGSQQLQQQGTSDGQTSSHSANHAAAALSRMASHDHSQNAWNTTNTSGQYQRRNAGSPALGFAASNTASQSNQNQPQNWQMQRPQATSFGARHNIPGQSAAVSNSSATSAAYENSSATRTDSYHFSYAQRETQQPPRYNSPQQAFQAHQYAQSTQGLRTSGKSQVSPQMAQNTRWSDSNTSDRQQSASVEPQPTTVNLSQVYDNRAELQRKAQIDAERRRKQEAEQAAKKAEEERLEAEKRKLEEEQRKAEVEKQKSEQEAAKKAAQEKKAEQRKKIRGEKKQSKSTASTSQKPPSAAPTGAASDGLDDEEAQMREMFRKMREFNAKNPAMLAKLWEEERTTHAQAQAKSSPAPPPPAPSTARSTAPTSSLPPANSPAVHPTSAPKQSSKAVEPPNNAPTIPPATSSMTPVQQPNTGIWPAHKKNYLADHTVKWLKALPQNSNSPITPENVFNILDRNPSYVQLCESLEQLGLKFDRGSLARVLLSAGPSTFKMENSKRVQSATSANKSPHLPPELAHQKVSQGHESIPAGPVNYETPHSLSQPLPPSNGNFAAPVAPRPLQIYGGTMLRATQSPYFAAPQPVGSGGRRASQSQPPEIKEEGRPEERPRPPADKEEAARKRTFGDLVDLTAQDSDEDEPPPKRVAAILDDDRAVPSPSTTLAYVVPQGFQHFAYRPPIQAPGPVTPVADLPAGSSNANGAQSSAQPNIVRSQYHTTPAPQPPVKSKGPSLEQIQASRMKGKMLVEPIMRDRVARKSKYDSRTIARDVLLATGRHPDMRSLNGHLVTMQKILGQHGGDPGGITGEGNTGHERGSRSDLGTIRWSIIDPEPSQDQQLEKERSVPLHDDARAELARKLGKRKQKDSFRLVEYVTPTREAQTPTSEERRTARRGRPPKNSRPLGEGYAKESLGKSAPRLSTANTNSTSTSRQATPSASATADRRNSMSSGAPVGYAAFRKYNEDGTEVKRKGRPVGWKKSVHSREAQGLPPKSSAAIPSRTKQQQTGPKAAVAAQQVEPQYQSYACGWAHCKAVLHNLETLKKHVIKLHATRTSDENEYECLWKSCVTAETQKGNDAPKSFDTIEEWAGHVDSEHLASMAWRLGDGPKADFSALRYDTSPDLPVYLLDRQGRCVTPIISPTPPPSSALKAQVSNTSRNSTSASPGPSTQAVRPVGRPPKDGNPRAQREGIDASLRRLEEQKRIIGPTMDRMGCVLADDGRRRGFLDDEDFEDEVSGSEYG